ncbi:PRC-barrel domain-containing protein [Nocardioides mangrovicus]|uniref:PRC-barrel domain-containing protein n=1 Tax=Nocardioides mangrovicus TaxID=2478913 RepID=UPI0018E0B9D5|nr:hypothetical protein [Nocardioides mangrovicus]
MVTFAGDDIAQVKDVVYAADGGAVAGFTLAGRGLLAGPLKQGLLWQRVHALGADAVMIRDDQALSGVDEVVAAAASADGQGRSGGGKVLGSRVLTDSGVDLGEVVDVVIEVGRPSGPDDASDEPCDVVGYEIAASESLAARRSNAAKGTKLLVPLPDQLAVSGEHLMVPAGAEGFVTDDLAGFGASVAEFRAQLASERTTPATIAPPAPTPAPTTAPTTAVPPTDQPADRPTEGELPT